MEPTIERAGATMMRVAPPKRAALKFPERRSRTLPEGDTIWRAARRIRDAMAGRPITAAASSASTALGERIVGSALEEVESRGKHLLLHTGSGVTVHTHLGMQGRWRLTRAVTPMTPGRAGAVLAAKWVFVECDGIRAVCERAAVVEVMRRRDLALHPVLRSLGPDVLAPGGIMGKDALPRARASASPTVGELLLDQKVVAGVGNIWRCETLFVCGVHPAEPVGELDDEQIETILGTASRLMAANLEGRPRLWVYRRAGLPCRRCGAVIRSGPLGAVNPRTAYWCPRCQQVGGGGTRPVSG